MRSKTRAQASRLVERVLNPTILLFLLLCLSLLAGCSTVGTREAVLMDEQEAFERGLMAYVRGDLAAAEKHLNEALSDDPHDLRAWELWRAVLDETGEADPAGIAPPAPATVPKPVSPAQLLHLVKTQSPMLRRTVFEVIEARARLREANVSISPELVLLARIYPLGFFTSLTQSLYGGLAKRKSMMNEAEQRIVEAVGAYANTKEELMAKALDAFVVAQTAETERGALRRWMDIQGERVRSAQIQADYAKMLPDEPLQLRADLSEFRERSARAEKQIGLARVTLNGLIGRDPGESLQLAPATFSATLPNNVLAMIDTARQQRYDFRQSAARVAQARAHKGVVRTSTPDLDLRASYGLRDKASTDTFQRGGSLAAVLRLPLLLKPLKAAQLDREQAIVRQLEMDQESLAAESAERVVEAYGEYEAALGQQRVAKAHVDAAAESLRIARVQDRWRGSVNPVKLDGEALRHAKATHDLTVADQDLQRALVKLHRAMGSSLEKLAGDATLSRAVPSVAGTTDRGRALWVWRPQFLQSANETQFFLDFLAARNIKTVFIYSPWSVRNHNATLRNFLRRAHAEGIEVHALHGEPAWISPDKRHGLIDFLDAVMAFNGAAGDGERFDAVHLDVEPQSLAAWDEPANRPRLISMYKDLVGQAASHADGALPIVVDLPVRFTDQEDGVLSVLQEILPIVDGVAFMAYRPTSDRVISSVQPFITFAGKGNGAAPRLWVGVSAKPEHLCGAVADADFESMIRDIEERLAGYASVRGVAIHEYDRYRLLVNTERPPRQGPPTCPRYAKAGAAAATTVPQDRTTGETGKGDDRAL